MELPPAEWIAYRSRIRDEHAAGWITAAQYLVLVAIADLHLAGEHDPTVAKIAAYAGCSPRTVQRARAIAQERGLLVVEPRFHDGWQETNRYALAMPPGPVRPKPAKPKGRQRVRASRKKEERKRPTGGESLSAIAQRRMIQLGLAR